MRRVFAVPLVGSVPLSQIGFARNVALIPVQNADHLPNGGLEMVAGGSPRQHHRVELPAEVRAAIERNLPSGVRINLQGEVEIWQIDN